jgi:4-aminobutyrate aminotransferase-like enzyme
LKPDIIAISGHFGGGLPISAVCMTADIAKGAAERGYFTTLSHATDPLLCAAGEESLDIVLDENMPRKSMQIERWIKSAFCKMVQEFEWIDDIHGQGILLGVELATD